MFKKKTQHIWVMPSDGAAFWCTTCSDEERILYLCRVCLWLITENADFSLEHLCLTIENISLSTVNVYYADKGWRWFISLMTWLLFCLSLLLEVAVAMKQKR